MGCSHVPRRKGRIWISVITDHLYQYSHQSDSVFLAPVYVCVDGRADPQATVKGTGLLAWLPPHAAPCGTDTAWAMHR